MTYTLVLVIVGAGLGGIGLGWYLTQQSASASLDRQRFELDRMLHQATDLLRQERGESMRAAMDTALSAAHSSLAQQLDAGREVFHHEREVVVSQVQVVRHELDKMASLVTELRTERAHQAGQFNSRLEQAAEVTNALARTTQSLRHALASPKARGQWGERMAEDVLRSAGFVHGINYTKQSKLATGGVPDYTFHLPHGHVVHMDVKFPLDNYLRWLEADEGPGRAALAKQFSRDVRQRIKELAGRAYIDPETTVDYLLLFVPNESVYGFLHEHDHRLIDDAISQKVVLCSPTTLFAVLAVIRQSVDNFLVERRSDEILGALVGLRDQWDRMNDPIEKMGRGLASAQKAFDDLSGRRVRTFERQLEKLEAIRDSRQLRAAETGGDGEPESLVGSGGVDTARTRPPAPVAAPPADRSAVAVGEHADADAGIGIGPRLTSLRQVV